MTMSLDTLIKAAHFVEMQEMKHKQTSPPTNSIYTSPITVSTPICIKQDLVGSSQPVQVQSIPRRIINNSFDIINPLVIDEGGEAKRKQPPMVFRSGTREVHNKLEKHRRAHLKECFDLLKRQLPNTMEEKKTSNLNILHSAHKTILALKKRERELEHEMEKLAREKIAYQQKLAILKKDVSLISDIDFANLIPDITSVDSNIISTTSENSDLSTIHNDEISVKDEITETNNSAKIISEVQLSINNELRFTKSITRALPVVTTNSIINGIKEGAAISQTHQVQTTALSVVPLGYPVNQGLVLQKVLVPKGITDLSQLVSNAPVTHFIATPQQLGGKVVPLVNTQYVVKPLVVVSTPSRPS